MTSRVDTNNQTRFKIKKGTLPMRYEYKERKNAPMRLTTSYLNSSTFQTFNSFNVKARSIKNPPNIPIPSVMSVDMKQSLVKNN